MFIKCGQYEIEFVECTKFFDRLKGFMFRLEPITIGKRFPRCKSIHTYFMFQDLDIIMTDKNHKIIKIYERFGSEKIIWPKRKVYYTYELPVGVTDFYDVGDTLRIIEKKESE